MEDCEYQVTVYCSLAFGNRFAIRKSVKRYQK